VVNPRPVRFTPGTDPVPIIYESGWAAGPVWTGVVKARLAGIRSLDRPVAIPTAPSRPVCKEYYSLYFTTYVFF
jgi:hypothetical protein